MFKVCRSCLARLRQGSGATDSDTSRECSSAAVGCDAAALVPLAFVNVTRGDGAVKGHWRTLAWATVRPQNPFWIRLPIERRLARRTNDLNPLVGYSARQ